jgi:hypothetical protein
MNPAGSGGSSTDVYRAASVGAAAYALCDTLHELGHLAATLLPLQVSVLGISSVGVSTTATSPVVALAGPLINLLLATALAMARPAVLSANWRYVAWLFGTVNLFNGIAYLLYSALLGSGDWATVFDSLGPPMLWRPAVGLSGIALYAGAIFASLGVLRMLIAAAVISRAGARRYCLAAYWAGGLVLTAASMLNPFSPWLILSSGIATGFGAMVGLVFISALLKGEHRGSVQPEGRSVHFGRAWAVSCSIASLAFVLVLGRGLQFTASGAQAAAADAARLLL